MSWYVKIVQYAVVKIVFSNHFLRITGVLNKSISYVKRVGSVPLTLPLCVGSVFRRIRASNYRMTWFMKRLCNDQLAYEKRTKRINNVLEPYA